MKIKQIILVSGLSGAGKSSVMTILEDIGYLCIDNFPLELLATLLQWIANNNDARYSYLALSTSAIDFKPAFEDIQAADVNLEAVFLDAADDVLVQRYQFTRNRHPLIATEKAKTLLQAIKKERAWLMGLPDEITQIDTSDLSIKSLRTIIETRFSKDNEKRFTISLLSFGYRYGLPLDADVIFDARLLNNPFWIDELKNQTGNDKAVQDFVFNDQRSESLLKRITAYLDFSFREFIKEQKSHMTVAVGCTGGKHRSVTLVNYLAEYYKEKHQILKFHRDIERK